MSANHKDPDHAALVDAKLPAGAGSNELGNEIVDESDLPEGTPESLREILEAPVVAEFVSFLRESSAKQADLARQQAERTFEIQRQQLAMQAAESERRHQIDRQRLELAATHGTWARWIVAGMLGGLVVLFVAYRERPEIAMDVAKGLAAIGGAVGIGWSLKQASGRARD